MNLELVPHAEERAELNIKAIHLPSSGSPEPIDESNWHHPMLALYQGGGEERSIAHVPTKLYLVPTIDWRSDLDGATINDFAPKPTAQSELPDIEKWVRQYVVGCIEIWSGKRAPMQLARWSHRKVHQQLVHKSEIFTENPKIRKIYISQPLESVAETTITLRIGERIRSLILRFEGVDRRWLCTEMVIL